MKTKILYSVAMIDNGGLITAIEAEKGIYFSCPVCNGEMILRKSNKTGKNTKRPHFAHKALTPNCTPETVLHFGFKTKVYHKLKKLLQKKETFQFNWICNYCHELHEGNLLKKAKEVALEYNLGTCQPDIVLLDENKKTIIAIEIVVTHKPEPEVLNYFKANNIILIQINLTDDKDLEDFEGKLANPDIVDVCFNPKCKVCGNYKQKTIMKVVEGPCWKCNGTMKIAVLTSGDGDTMEGMDGDYGQNLPPSDFTEEQIAFARKLGVLLKKQYSHTMHESYIGNTCPKCDALAGEFYLFTQYICLANLGELPYDDYFLGYRCDFCNYTKIKDQYNY